ncbi:MAG: hypothetical protein AB1775_06720 [Bacteroidota bacterium]
MKRESGFGSINLLIVHFDNGTTVVSLEAKRTRLDLPNYVRRSGDPALKSVCDNSFFLKRFFDFTIKTKP